MRKTFFIVLLIPIIGICQTNYNQHDVLISEATEPIAQKALDGNAEGQSIHTTRAGLVLVSPFLPKLFERLGYLENGTFSDAQTKNRGVHILEYVASGLENADEQDLIFQKLLVGLAIDSPVEPIESLTDEEIELSRSMLQAVISNWEKIANTSIDGLRANFLVREGLLIKSNENWTLNVAQQGKDILIDFIPWNIEVIKLPWMEQEIQVNWR